VSSGHGVRVREFVAGDIRSALELWATTEGIGLNESDTPEALERFLQRNVGFSAIAALGDGTVIGAVLCGHDGRRGTIHHLAVAKSHRGRGVAKHLLQHCVERLEEAQIPRCNLFLYGDNLDGLNFWQHNGWGVVATWQTLQRRLGSGIEQAS
jgi:putative acetyltransferase